MSDNDPRIADRQSSAAGVMARLWWMLLGNVLLAFSLVFIFERSGGFFHAADVVFWITVASLVLIRYVDIRFLDGRTTTNAPTSIRHWIRYVALLVLCSGALWALAHATSYALAGRGS